MSPRWALVFAGLCTLAPGTAAQHSAMPSRAECSPVRFHGQVNRHKDFERAVSPGLVLRLRASKDPVIDGWTIEIASRKRPDPEVEFSWVPTQPYRFWNPRYVDTSYGWTAAQAVSVSPREFNFVLTDADFDEASQAVRIQLWPAGHSEEERRQASRVWERIKVGAGSSQFSSRGWAQKAIAARSIGCGSRWIFACPPN